MKFFANYRALIGIVIISLLFTSVRFVFEQGVFTETKENPAEKVEYIGSSTYYSSEDEEHFLFIAGPNEHINALVEEVLFYQNKLYDTVSKDDEFVLEDYDVVVSTVDNYLFMDGDFEVYVANGGGLVILSDGLFNWDEGLFGMTKVGASQIHTGIRMNDDGMMMSAGDEYLGDYFHVFGSYFDLDRAFNVHMESINGMPLMFSRDYGHGKFVVANNSLVTRKTSMSVISSAISLSKSTYIYPTYNAFQLHIDDWVAPVPDRNYEYGTGRISTVNEVFRQDWWPWIISMSRDLELELSLFIIGNYGNITTGIGYDNQILSIEDNGIYLLEAITNGYEMGVHGENHQSLTVSDLTTEIYGYNPWIDQLAMEKSLEFLQNSFYEVYPDYLLSSYVPPSNSMDEVGYQALVESMEDLKVIGAVFDDEVNELVYNQIYHLDENNIAHFPRHTAGYIHTESVDWAALNGVVTTGVFAHFIHPDDIIDPVRSQGLSITEMQESLESLLREAKEKFGFLNTSTLTEGYNQVLSHDLARINFEDKDDVLKIYIEHLYDGVGFYLRTDREVNFADGAEVYPVDSMTYFVVPQVEDVTIYYVG